MLMSLFFCGVFINPVKIIQYIITKAQCSTSTVQIVQYGSVEARVKERSTKESNKAQEAMVYSDFGTAYRLW